MGERALSHSGVADFIIESWRTRVAGKDEDHRSHISLMAHTVLSDGNKVLDGIQRYLELVLIMHRGYRIALALSDLRSN